MVGDMFLSHGALPRGHARVAREGRNGAKSALDAAAAAGQCRVTTFCPRSHLRRERRAALSGRWVLELQDLRLRIVELGLGLIGGARVRVRTTG